MTAARLLPIALAVLLSLPLAWAAAPAPCEGTAPDVTCAVSVRDVTGTCAADGRLKAGQVSYGSACAHDGNGGQAGGSADAAQRNVSTSMHGQSSESGSLSPYRSDNGTFHCASDGCAMSGDTGSGPAGLAANVTPHFTVDATGPTLALAANGTGDLDGDDAPDVVFAAGCGAPGTASPCGNPALAVTFGRDKLKGSTRLANGTAAADLDGDGLLDLAAGEGCVPDAAGGLDCGETGAYLLANGTGVRVKPIRCELQRCGAGASAPGGFVLVENDGDVTTLFVAAAGSAHGCAIRHEASQQAIQNCK